MNVLISRINFILFLFLFLILAGLPSLPSALAAPAYYDDPFYEQKGTDRVPATFQQVAESVNPFTGNVNLTHTDAILPGNGGLDLKIIRSYNGRIYGAKDPYSGQAQLAGATERSVLGLGWSFHFGRIRNPEGKVYSSWYTEPPAIEMPDGSIHPVYVDKNNSSQRISKEYWIYRQVSSSPRIYELVLTDGTIYTFPESNKYLTDYTNEEIFQVSKITTPNGNTITFSYDSTDARLIQSITDSVGRVITFTYKDVYVWGQSGQVARKALDTMTANGRVYTYKHITFNDQFLLEEVVPPAGPSWKYSYYTTDPQRYELMTVTYLTGAILTYGYNYMPFEVGTKDQWGNPTPNEFLVVTTRSLSGRDITSAYWDFSYGNDTNGDQVTTVTQSGCSKTESYTYKSLGSVKDSNGNPYRVTYGSIPLQVNPPQLWQVGMLLKKEIRSGGTVIQEEVYNWMAGTLISNETLKSGYWVGSYIYDNGIYVPLLSSKIITRYDSNGLNGKAYKTAYSNYDNYGNPQTIIEYGGWTQFQGNDNGEAIRTTTITYYTDPAKNIVGRHPDVHKVNNAFPTDYDYDANGNVSTLNQYGVITTFGYTNGNVTSRTNARNYTTNIQYTYGRVSGITNPVYSISRTVNWDGTIASETGGRGNTTSFSYDSLGRLIQITPPLEAITTITYDNTDPITGEMYWQESKGSWFKRYYIDGLGRIIRTEDSEGIKTRTTYNTCGQVAYRSYPYTTTNIGDSFVYDVLGRVRTITHPDNTNKTYLYPSGNVSLVNERGIATTYNYRAFGNPDEKLLSSVTDATGTTSYEYNDVGSLKNITHPNGLIRTFTYNTKNFLISETHPESGTISYNHDAVGNVSQRTDGKGITYFTYDAIDRMTAIDYPGMADDASFAYDNANNRTSMSSSAAAYSYAYDAENRLTQQTLTIDGTDFTTSYGYDTRGNLTSLTYPTGRAVTYTYDTANRATSLVGYITNVTYHPSGGMGSIQYANGKTATFNYNSRYWVDWLKVNTWNTTPDVLYYDYTYDAVGNITNLYDLLDSVRHRSMGYDNVDRLTFASGIWGLMDFGYDALGNRTSKTVNGSSTTYSYSGTTNLLTSAAGAEADSYIYDTNGNMTGIRGKSLAYDYANRITSVDGGSVTYTYDGDGKRVKKAKKDNGVVSETTLYYYDPTGNVLEEEVTDPFGRTKRTEYLYLNGQHVARIDNDVDTSNNIPDSLSVSVVNTNRIDLSWTGPTANVHHYEVWRSDSNGSYILIATTPQTSYTDNSVQADKAYLYRVRAVDAAGNILYYSDMGLTTTIIFTDNPLNPNGTRTIVKAEHLTDLRKAINAVRRRAGLSDAWSGTSLDPSTVRGQIIYASHWQELRDNLTPALNALGFSVPLYDNLAQEWIRASHISQLRGLVQ